MVKSEHDVKKRIAFIQIAFRDNTPIAKALVHDQVMSADPRKQNSAKNAADDTPVL
jgi:hypothetical protein